MPEESDTQTNPLWTSWPLPATRYPGRVGAEVPPEGSVPSPCRGAADVSAALLSPDGFHGDVYLTVKLLLPGVIKSVYNLNDKQIVKLFSRIFNCNPDDMARDLEQVRGKGKRGPFSWRGRTCCFRKQYHPSKLLCHGDGA